MFSLINRVTDNESTRLVMTAKQSAAQTKVLLPDLQSRFQWATGFQVQPLNDEEKINALILRAQWRGLELPNDVAAFMTQRLGRSMRDLMKALNELDKASITYLSLIHISEPTRQAEISYAVFCLKKKKQFLPKKTPD